MKKIIGLFFLCVAFLSIQGISYAQSGAPNGINYQAVIRDNMGTLVANSPVAIRINIRQNSASGVVIFSEKHLVTTTQYGLVNFVIGAGAFLNGGPFATINWGNGPYYLDLGVAFSGLPNPTTYMAYGTQQMMSVPYALYAKSSGNLLNQWKYGVGVPAVSLGTTGDYYLDTATGNVYSKTNGTMWILISNIMGPQGPLGLTGAQGIQGVPGPTGAVGATGPIGLTGPAGATGTTGAQGIQGLSGTNGTNGAVGATGPIGLTGPAGANGAQGIPGATGPQGPQGATGLTGPAGAQGIQGLPGTNGAVGATGPTGLTGLTGATGAQGIQGTNGTNGSTLLNGIIAPSTLLGNDGDFYINTATNMIYGPKSFGIWPTGVSIVGPQGIQGVAGATGPQGIQGLPGPSGASGTNGTNGATGPIGLTGPAGAQGIQGLPGTNGAVGATGPAGAQGIQGVAGPTGPIGLTGATGPQGIQGLTGPSGATGPAGPAGAQGSSGQSTSGTNTLNLSLSSLLSNNGNNAHNLEDYRLDKQNNIVILLQTNGPNTIFGATTIANTSTVLLVKLDSLGNYIWHNSSINGYGWGNRAIAIDSLNNIYCSVGGNLFKFNSNGTLAWQNNVGGTGSAGITVDSQNNVITACGTMGNTCYSSPSSCGANFIIRKYSPSGSVIWTHVISQGTILNPTGSIPTITLAHDLVSDNSNNIYFSCSYGSFNNTPGGKRILKISSAGSQLWSVGANTSNSNTTTLLCHLNNGTLACVSAYDFVINGTSGEAFVLNDATGGIINSNAYINQGITSFTRPIMYNNTINYTVKNGPNGADEFYRFSGSLSKLNLFLTADGTENSQKCLVDFTASGRAYFLFCRKQQNSLLPSAQLSEVDFNPISGNTGITIVKINP